MLDGVNDSPAQAQALLRLLRGDGSAAHPGLPCKVNLIPFNPFAGVGPEAFAAGARRGVRRSAPATAGIVTTVRKTRGDDIAAACGQLAGEVQDRTRVAERRARASPVRIAAPVSRRRAGAAGLPGHRP